MPRDHTARRAARGIRSSIVAALVLAGAALAHQSLAASSSSAVPPVDLLPGGPDRLVPGHPAPPLGAEDGAVPDGVTAFDDEIPAVARLDPALSLALRRAAADAADEGVEIFVNSGWRSRAHQERLLDEAVAKYGSAEEAARWVATPDTSPHVSGEAIDIGPSDAAEWLADRGAGYGLCRIYRNEPWHFERRPLAVDHGCPPTYEDPTHDPRMQQ